MHCTEIVHCKYRHMLVNILKYNEIETYHRCTCLFRNLKTKSRFIYRWMAEGAQINQVMFENVYEILVYIQSNLIESKQCLQWARFCCIINRNCSALWGQVLTHFYCRKYVSKCDACIFTPDHFNFISLVLWLSLIPSKFNVSMMMIWKEHCTEELQCSLGIRSTRFSSALQVHPVWSNA